MAHPIPTPPPATLGDIELSNTRLHYVKAGCGDPLVIVPATVSLIRQWQPLTQFLGLTHEAYFFELPGHGGSSPYPFKFKSEYVPSTVEAFVDALGFERFSLMGFSFGGLLAMRTIEYLQDRIDKVILLSPLVSHKALKFSQAQQLILKTAIKSLKYTWTQETASQIMHIEQLEKPLISILSRVTNIDPAILESKDALKIPVSTLDVFAHTASEILEMDYCAANLPLTTPCYFGMSVNDDMIDYDLTEASVKRHFSDLKIQKFHHLYHQSPEPPTFEWLWREFGEFLEMLR
jgi:pimeloyl-ACP methyl ester carboxylesterase